MLLRVKPLFTFGNFYDIIVPHKNAVVNIKIVHVYMFLGFIMHFAKAVRENGAYLSDK